MTIVILGILIVVTISIAWASGVDMMKQQHPNYKGEDFLNWDGKHDDWDKSHTEGEI